MYSAEITGEDMALVQASIIHCVRRMQLSGDEPQAIRFTAAAAETISRLNHGQIDQGDVLFINTCMQKMLEIARTGRSGARRLVMQRLQEVQNKFDGGQSILLA